MSAPHRHPPHPNARGHESGRRGPLDRPLPPELEDLSGEQRARLRRARVAAMWVGLVLPVFAALTTAVLLITWLPFTPDPIATHWSGSAPDGFMSAGANVFMVSGLSAGLGLLIGGMAVFGSGRGGIAVWSAMNRFLAAMSLTISVSIALLGVLSTNMQLGLADARHAGSVDGALALAFGIGVVLGIAGYFVQPGVYIAGSEGKPAEAVALAATERAVWLGRVRPTGGLLIMLAVTIAILAGSTLAIWLTGSDPLALGIMSGTTLLLVLLISSTLWYRVRVDAAGLEARSTIGWPVFRVPAADVAHAASGHITPLSDFGGWGMRWAPGRFGLVMRTGEGLIITRKDGRIFALTLDDAATAAGLLEAYATADAPARQPEHPDRSDKGDDA